jgi:anti-sigma regulatory factor (Ser/Thr protein kinase)
MWDRRADSGGQVTDALVGDCLAGYWRGMDWWLDTTPATPRAARALVGGEIDRHGWRGDKTVAVLLTSEIVCNALQHGHGGCSLRVSVTGGALRVEAADDGEEMPELRHPAPDELSGRGLMLVDELSSAWGVERTPPVGKRVWFDLGDDSGPVEEAPGRAGWREGRRPPPSDPEAPIAGAA